MIRRTLILAGLFLFLIAAGLSGLSSPLQAQSGTELIGESLLLDDTVRRGRLTVYARANRFSPVALERFAKLTGYQVRLEHYRNPYELIATVNSGNLGRFDLALFPGTLLNHLVEGGYLSVLPNESLTNLNHISPRFAYMAHYRYQRFAVPLFWSFAGLLSRGPDLPATWNTLFQPGEHRRTVILPGTPREALGLALLSLGHSLNSISRTQIMEAARKISRLAESPLFLGFVNIDQGAEMSRDGFLNISPARSRSASAAVRRSPDLSFRLAEEGIPAELELLGMLKESPNQDLAGQFIDFMLTPSAAALNANHTHRPTTNRGALTMLHQEDRQDQALYPNLTPASPLEFYADLGPGEELYEEAWIQITGNRYVPDQ